MILLKDFYSLQKKQNFIIPAGLIKYLHLCIKMQEVKCIICTIICMADAQLTLT